MPRDHSPFHRIGLSLTAEWQENNMYGSTLQLVSCPQCLAPAEISDRFVLDSTSGPVEHITVRCVNRHWFTITAEHLPSSSCRKPTDAVRGATSATHGERQAPVLPAAGLSP